MLEGLDQIEWDKLTHAYGSAEDVPELIRDLASPDIKTRSHGLSQLHRNIYHQGQIYEATSYAVPFLIELIQSPDAQDKHKILSYLAGLSEGYSPTFTRLPYMREFFGEDPTTEAVRSQLMEKLDHVTATYNAVYQGIDIYFNLLADESSEHRIKLTIFDLLSHFSKQWETIIPRIRPDLAVGSNTTMLVNALELYGKIGYIVLMKNQEIVNELTPFLNTDFDPMVCFAAAQSLARIAREDTPQIALEILAHTLDADDDFVQQYKQYHLQSNPAKSAAIAFGYVGFEAAEPFIPDIIESLRPLNWASGIPVVSTLFDLLFGDQKLSKQATVHDLTPLQHQLLRTVAEKEFLGTLKKYNANMCDIALSHGAPDSQEKLLKFLGEA